MYTYDLTNLRVLIVDDSRYMLKIIRTLLDAMGISAVRGVESAENIFAEIKNWKPDLIITDHIMEPINGLELIKRIRSQEEELQRFIPIILLTGYAHEDVVRDARFRVGADAVLVKPVSVTRLYSCIVSIYESSRTFVDNGAYFGPDRRVKDRPFEGADRRDDEDGEHEQLDMPDTTRQAHDGLDYEDLELELVDVSESRSRRKKAQTPRARR
jgi:CheY-like chemotaxis protein